MALSSNSIIHFTKNITSLKGILTENFKLKYCRETIISKTSKIDLLIPMVSFCDIPFSQILNHIDNYGSYGIGLKKRWGESKGLNPVFYLEKNSGLSDNIINHLYERIRGEKGKMDELEEIDKYNFDFLRYIKNYEADLKRLNKVTVENYRFSDEREWRYVIPPLDKQIFVKLPNDVNNQKIKKLKEVINKTVEDTRLKFEPEDINYIIIKKENERDAIIKVLESVNSMHAHEQVKRLTSRIISVEQIRTDF